MNKIVAITTAAAVPLAVSPAIAGDPDQELIALGNEFDAGFKDLVDAHKDFEKVHDDFWALVEREAPPENENLNVHLAWVQRARETTELGRKFSQRSDMIDAALTRLEPLTKSIQGLPALSVRGLGIKAKASAVANCHLWRDPLDEMDWDDRASRCLIEANMAVAGLPAPQQYLSEDLLKWWKHPAKPHPDAELLALVEQWDAADTKYRELVDTVERMDEVIYAYKRHPVPEALRWRAKDQKLGLPTSYMDKDQNQKLLWTTAYSVKVLRGKRFLMGFVPKNRMEVKPVFKSPSKAARARADEIIAAYDSWAKEGKPPRGYKKAVRERDKANDAATALENKIIATRANTVDGMRAKIRCAYRPADLQYGKADLEQLELEQIDGRADEIAASIFRDLLRWTSNGTEATHQPAVSNKPAAKVDDPIFAAIEAHRKACVENSKCCALSCSLRYDDPSKPGADATTRESIDYMFDLARGLLAIRPTTRAGAAALLDHASRSEDPDGDWRFPDTHVNGRAFHLALMKHVADALGSI